jgi:hypothetical protein
MYEKKLKTCSIIEDTQELKWSERGQEPAFVKLS